MSQVPAALRGTAWEDWIATAPPVSLDTSGKAYYADAMHWLAETPGPNAVPDETERSALLIWITRYQQKLLNGKNDGPSLGEDRLILGFWSFLAGTIGSTLAAKLGLLFLGPAPVVVAAAMALTTITYAAVSVGKNARKATRNRMIQTVIDRLERLAERLS